MSQSLNPTGSNGNGGSSGGYRRDYGSTSSSNNTIINVQQYNNIPDVNFAGFSPTEFISLSENIAHNIGVVKQSWRALDKAIPLIGTTKDDQNTRDKVHQIQTKTNQTIQMTSKDLQRLTVVVRRGDKQQKLQVEKLTSDFKIIVEKYSMSQQLVANKMKASLLAKSTNDFENQQHHQQLNEDDEDNEELIQKQQTVKKNLQFEQNMLIDRERRVQQIEADVLDINQIMKELSTLINQQGDIVDTIENSIDHATGDIETGTQELIKAAANQAKYRRKVLILLVIAVIIGLIVTGIIVSQLKR